MAEITIRISDTALKVALVALGAILLLGGVAYFWSSGVLRPKYQIQMFVSGAEGIQPGASVRLNGIRVGSVSRIELVNKPDDSNRRIKLELRIEQRFQNFIRDDSTASLTTASFLGNRYVNIEPGPRGAPIRPDGEIRAISVRELTLTDFIDAVGKTTNCLDGVKISSDGKSPASKLNPQKSQ